MPSILVIGPYELGPIGRHAISFCQALATDPACEIFVPTVCLNRRDKDDVVRLVLSDHVHFIDDVLSQSFDFMIFTGTLSTKKSDVSYRRLQKINAKVRICYPVFDGTVPPLDWIGIINENFDICASPSRYVAENFVRYGIRIPCLGVHCGILNQELLDLFPSTNARPCRFGFIGAAEQRKNPIKVVRAFRAAFSGKKAELYMHCSYSFEKSYVKELIDCIHECQKDAKIIFRYGVPLSHDEMVQVFRSFDCYVYPSKSTGYFTTPAEALSLGCPVIVSDIGVHVELANDAQLDAGDGFFLVKADIAEPIFHRSLDGRALGVQYDCNENDIRKAMVAFYDRRDSFRSEVSIQKRKDAGRRYNAKNLAPLYRCLVHPAEVALSSEHTMLTKDCFICPSRGLAAKYQEIWPDMKTSISPYEPVTAVTTPSERAIEIEKQAVHSQECYLRENQVRERGPLASFFFRILGRINGRMRDSFLNFYMKRLGV